jgi:proteasome beta subunit
VRGGHVDLFGEQSVVNNPIIQPYHGTTTIGLVCKDGVVFATDTRVTSGYFIAHRQGKKVYKIDDHVAVTIAGYVADAQNIIDAIRYYANMYRLEKKSPIPIRSAARVAANVFFSSRLYPYVAQVLIGGVDTSGPGVYNVDFFGSMTQETFVATGSGSPVAYGVLEAEYSPELTVRQAIPLAIKAMMAAMKRNAGTGDSFDVAFVPQGGVYREVSDEEKRRYVKDLGILG